MKRTPRTLVAVLATIATTLTLLLVPAAGAQTAETGTVTVLHGVPGLTVDVYANGDVLVAGFEPGDQFGPAELPAGDYAVAIRAAGSAADSAPAIAADVTVPAGVNASAIAHLDASGNPTLGVFVNDVSGLDPDTARVTVRHTAAFGAVDVLAGGSAIFSGVTNPNEGSVEVPAGTYAVAVTAAGDPATQAFAGDVAFEAGTAYFIHAIGDPTADTFDLLIQTVSGLQTEVLGVTTGSGGLLEESGGTNVAALLAVVLGAILLAGAPALAVLRRRR